MSLSVCMSDRRPKAYAVAADENGQFQQAAAGYEAALRSDPGDIEATVNLMVLYWQVTNRHAACAAPMPADFRSHALERLRELLDSAARRFTLSAEVRFWKKYIAADQAGRSFELAEGRRLLREDPDYLEPAFVVFSDSAGAEAEPQAMRLLADYSEQPTARGRYVTAMISAGLRRQRWREAATI